jgi:GT2 family glycosyltransferase
MSFMHDNSEPVSILAVIVLYRMAPSESPAFRSLQASAINLNQCDARVKILLYDNTPGGQKSGVLPNNTEYWAASRNQGIAPAYNFALGQADTQGFDWLLTLDQDTTVPEHFLERVYKILQVVANCPDIAAIVPEVSDHGVLISPNIVSLGRSIRLPKDFIGIAKGELSAINSATTWRVRTWREIGGFNPLFWLDSLDRWAYYAIQHAGNRVYVAKDLHVEHKLSLLDPSNQMTPARYENYLGARCAFCDLHGNILESVILIAYLTHDLYAQFLNRESTDLRHITWTHLKRMILWTRKSRIEAWKKDMMNRMENITES